MRFAKLFDVQNSQVLVQVAEDSDGFPYVTFKLAINGVLLYEHRPVDTFQYAGEFVRTFTQADADAYYQTALTQYFSTTTPEHVH